MLPSTLFSVYQQYKKDTDSVASWLASTAKACGYSPDLLNSTVSQPKVAGRLKGKARKEAKKQQIPNPSPQQSTPKYIIAIKDFIPLAEYICACTKPVISVPVSFTETINRVIHVRAGFGAQLAEEGAVPNAKADATHSFFVGVLEKVREVLRPRMPAETPPFEPFEDSGNKFDPLHVYEPSQEFLDAPDIVRPQNAKGDSTTYEAEPQKTMEDAMMAYMLMYQDLDKIRGRISSIWLSYQDGYVDVASAAIVTNTGIDLARNLMDQILPIFEDHGGAVRIGQQFSLWCAIQEGFDPEDILTWGPDGPNEEVYDVADKTYFNASLLISSLVQCLSPKDVPLYQEGMFGTYDPKEDRSTMGGRAKFNEDQIILSEFFTEAAILARLVPGYPVEDEFTRGLREVDRTGKMPFYLVFASQILLDIHHIIRDGAYDAFETLSTQTTTMDNDLQRHIDFHKDLKSDTWPASNDRALRDFQKTIKWLGQDPVFNAKQKIAQKLRQPITEAERHRVLVHSPIICGLLLYHFRAGMYDIGLAVANAWGSLTYSAHLYNTLQHENLMVGRWEDMDVAYSLLGTSSFFVGDPPTNKEDYYKRFLLQMGYSASTFANIKGRRSNKKQQNVASRAGPRRIKEGAPVSYMFIERYYKKSGQVDLSPEHVDEIVSRSRFQEEKEFDEGELVTLSLIEDPKELKRKRQLKERKKAVDGAQLKPEELLRSLALALGAETLEFSFPYLILHRMAWVLLRAIKEECDPILKQLYTPAYLERESELPFMVGYIFMAAVENPDGKGDELLREAADAL
ncbi:hypothetical protein FDECE_2117, partial [Fusarium decemcellulare]